jgi:diguanylate cyclase (GGDEF)-like protein
VDIEGRLSNVLSEFARTLLTDFPIQAILDHLVVRIVDVLPISAAGVTLIEPGVSPRYIAASDGSALRFEQLQSELGEGPCLAAYASGEAISVPDLSDDDRFPAFASRALEAGLVAVFTFPLRQGGRPLGALDLYRTSAGALDAAAMVAAQTLADVAAAYLLNAQARAELQDKSDRSLHVALHDSLTGLPNRVMLGQRLEHALLRSRRSKKLIAVLFIDLDKFKPVNDTYGHHVGDELLVKVAGRLSSLVRPGDTVARLSGDEFVVVCEDIDRPAQIQPVADRLATALADPFVVSTGPIRVSASVGIAFARPGDDRPDLVVQQADAAMYQAKRQGGGRCRIVDPHEQPRHRTPPALVRDLHGAAARGELRGEYQPIVAASSGQITGVEALLRWNHPTRGQVGATSTIELAERSGLIGRIGRWVLAQGCRDLRRWPDLRRDAPLGLTVNVSGRELLEPDFVATVRDVLADTGTDPTLITVDVTETVFAQDGPRAKIVLGELKDMGVGVALDDFGAGHSSLSFLSRFPLDVVKLDSTLVADLGSGAAARLTVNAVVLVAHGLHQMVTAEGVETREQRDQVAAAGCDFAQGFFFARPMSAEGVATLLADGDAAATGLPRPLVRQGP